MKEIGITRAIVETYTTRFLEAAESDVIIAGAGPSGLTAAYYLAGKGLRTTIIEKKLSCGGGIWGGGTGHNIIVVEETDILDEMGVAHEQWNGFYTAGAVELAAALTYRAEHAGARVFNLTEVEDIVVKEGSIRGVVVNGTPIVMAGLHVDPVCMGARVLVDATGHAAELVCMLRKKNPDALPGQLCEGFMDVEPGERGVVDRAGEVFPGLYLTGMSVCAVHGLPRMGPIFGGMLKSGHKVAGQIAEALGA